MASRCLNVSAPITKPVSNSYAAIDSMSMSASLFNVARVLSSTSEIRFPSHENQVPPNAPIIGEILQYYAFQSTFIIYQ